MGQPVVHFEIGGRDRAQSEAFFGALFGWTITRSGPASNIAPEGPGGIGGHLSSLGHEPHNYVTFYVQVDDIEAYLVRVAALGGKTIVPPVNIPTGRFAWFADLDGNTLGLWTPKP